MPTLNPSIVGFVPVRTLSGNPISYSRVQAISNNSTAIFTGDPITPASTGLWDLSSAGGGASVGNICCGVWYRKSDNKLTKEPYLPASTTYTDADGEDGCNWLIVVQNPADVIFRATASAATPIALAQTDLGLNYDFAAGTGSTATGMSGSYLNTTGRATTNTLQFRVLQDGFWRNPFNDRTKVNPVLLCMINVGTYPPSLNITGT